MSQRRRATDDTERLLERWRTAYAAPAVGWDLSELDGRVVESEPDWSWDELARSALAAAGSALDLGTGGGEQLLAHSDVLPDDTHATEGGPPNLPVARQALEPLGIPVSEHDAERGQPLPYDDDRFDLVLSRHEAYRATEVRRVLRPGGTFLTQQVDGHNLDDLARLLGCGPAYPDVTLAVLRDEAEAAGLRVDLAREWSGPIRFDSVHTLVSYLRWMPWQLPDDFTVDRYAEVLLGLHRADDPPEFTERRFLIRALAP